MYEIYGELKRLLKKENITVIDFCKNILKKSRTSLFHLFKERRTRTDLDEDEIEILETIESWICNQNRSSVLEFEETVKRNKPNATSVNSYSKEDFSGEINIQNVRHNIDILKKKLKERQILVEDFTKSVLKSNLSAFRRLSKKESYNDLTKKEKYFYSIVINWLTEKRNSSSPHFVVSSFRSNYNCSSKNILKELSNTNKLNRLYIRTNRKNKLSSEIRPKKSSKFVLQSAKAIKSFNIIKAVAVAVKNKYKNINARKKNNTNGCHLKVKRIQKYKHFYKFKRHNILFKLTYISKKYIRFAKLAQASLFTNSVKKSQTFLQRD